MLNTETLNATIKGNLQALFDGQQGSSPISSDADLAQAMADAFTAPLDIWIKQATVTTPAGVAVATAGTAAAQTGATTAPGIGSIT